MFSRRNRGRGSREPFTYIQQDTTIRGDIEAGGRVRIHGTVLGNVRVEGLLEVAAEGVIRGGLVEAEQVRILGEVEALVSAVGKVEIWSGGRLDGDVRAASLDIEEGAGFTGRSEMRPPGGPAALPRSTGTSGGSRSDGSAGEGARTTSRGGVVENADEDASATDMAAEPPVDGEPGGADGGDAEAEGGQRIDGNDEDSAPRYPRRSTAETQS